MGGGERGGAGRERGERGGRERPVGGRRQGRLRLRHRSDWRGPRVRRDGPGRRVGGRGEPRRDCGARGGRSGLFPSPPHSFSTLDAPSRPTPVPPPAPACGAAPADHAGAAGSAMAGAGRRVIGCGREGAVARRGAASGAGEAGGECARGRPPALAALAAADLDGPRHSRYPSPALTPRSAPPPSPPTPIAVLGRPAAPERRRRPPCPAPLHAARALPRPRRPGGR